MHVFSFYCDTFYLIAVTETYCADLVNLCLFTSVCPEARLGEMGGKDLIAEIRII